MSNKISNDKPAAVAAVEEEGEIAGGQKVRPGPKNVIHTIKDVLGKDDNINKIKNVADLDITDKWAFDAYPLQAVLDLGVPGKEIDYLRICSENEQPFTLDFSNDNTLKGYSKAQKGTLKRGINDIKVPKDVVARFVRLEFSGNKTLDEDKNKKPDPLGIYYIQVGQGEIDNSKPLPLPPTAPSPPGPLVEPPKPTEGRIKDWGGDINKGADKWQVVAMKDNRKIHKVVDASGTNIADLFNTPESAKAFVAWHQWKQGVKPEPEKPKPPSPPPGPGPVVEPPEPGNPPSGTGVDKNGVKLLVSKGTDINYTFNENFRPDGKRFDFNGIKAASTEATGYFMFTSNPVDDEVSFKWSQKSHSGSNKVECYDSGISTKNGKSRLRWEDPHPDYHKMSEDYISKAAPLESKWIGYKGIRKVLPNGNVLIELYQDTGNNETKPSNTWTKIFSHEDSKYKVGTPAPYVTIRIDDPAKQGQKNLKWKWLSVATI